MGGVPSPRPLPHPQTPSLPFPAPRQHPAAFVLLLPGCGDAGRGLGSGPPARRVPGDRDQAAPEPRDAIPGIPELPARHPAGAKALPCARTAAGSCGGSRGGSDVAGQDLLPGSGGRQERHCPRVGGWTRPGLTQGTIRGSELQGILCWKIGRARAGEGTPRTPRAVPSAPERLRPRFQPFPGNCCPWQSGGLDSGFSKCWEGVLGSPIPICAASQLPDSVIQLFPPPTLDF